MPKDLSYLLATLKEIIFNFKFFDVKLKGEGIDFKDKIILAAITNSSCYGGMFEINPLASLQDGKLNLCLIKPMGRIKALMTMYKVIKGTHTSLPEIEMLEITSLNVSSALSLPWEVDGEVLEPQTNFKVDVLREAMNVLVP